MQNFTNIDSELPTLSKTKSHPDLDVKSIDFAPENASSSSKKSKKSDSTRKSLIDIGIGTFTYDSKNSNFNYDLGNFEPVDTQSLYLDIYSLEQEIKRMEPEIYLKMKEFMIGSDKTVTYMEINRFSEDISYELFKRKSLSRKWREKGEEHLMELL